MGFLANLTLIPKLMIEKLFASIFFD